jgi:biotin transport system substrate-specific component
MDNNRLFTSTWIESFILKGKSEVNFTFITKVLTVIVCSLILVLSAKIKVDLYPVPMTLQPLAILMIAMLCGRNISVATVSLYLFQGMIGLPVFAYGGGLPYLMGPTGGFLFGFLMASLIVGELADRGWGKFLFKSVFAMMLGMLTIYTFGIIQLGIINGFQFSIIKSMQPFIIGDFYKLVFASILLPQIWKFTKASK